MITEKELLKNKKSIKALIKKWEEKHHKENNSNYVKWRKYESQDDFPEYIYLQELCFFFKNDEIYPYLFSIIKWDNIHEYQQHFWDFKSTYTYEKSHWLSSIKNNAHLFKEFNVDNYLFSSRYQREENETLEIFHDVLKGSSQTYLQEISIQSSYFNMNQCHFLNKNLPLSVVENSLALSYFFENIENDNLIKKHLNCRLIKFDRKEHELFIRCLVVDYQEKEKIMVFLDYLPTWFEKIVLQGRGIHAKPLMESAMAVIHEDMEKILMQMRLDTMLPENDKIIKKKL